MKLYHGVNNNTKTFELKINQDIELNLMGDGVYFFDSYEAAKKLYASSDEGLVHRQKDHT